MVDPDYCSVQHPVSPYTLWCSPDGHQLRASSFPLWALLCLQVWRQEHAFHHHSQHSWQRVLFPAWKYTGCHISQLKLESSEIAARHQCALQRVSGVQQATSIIPEAHKCINPGSWSTPEISTLQYICSHKPLQTELKCSYFRMLSQRGMYFQKESMLFPRVFYPHKQSCSLEILPLASLLCLAFQHWITEQVSINFGTFPLIICSYFLVYYHLS